MFWLLHCSGVCQQRLFRDGCPDLEPRYNTTWSDLHMCEPLKTQILLLCCHFVLVSNSYNPTCDDFVSNIFVYSVKKFQSKYMSLTCPKGSRWLLVNFNFWKDTSCRIQCAPVAGESEWTYSLPGIAGSAFPVTDLSAKYSILKTTQSLFKHTFTSF